MRRGSAPDRIRRSRRVATSHAIARAAFGLTIAFLVVAAVWWWAEPGASWAVLHAFLAGGVLMAISGATQLFTVTWAAAAPPNRRIVSLQRASLAIGVILVLVGVTRGSIPMSIAGGGAVIVGLVTLAGILVSSIRRSLLRRFDVATRYYIGAIVAGVVGIALALMLVSGAAGEAYQTVRVVHAHVNLLGLVGLTIIGTLPTIVPTFAHHPAVSGREARLASWAGFLGVASMIAGLALGPGWVGAGTVTWAIVASLVLGSISLRLGRDRLRKGRLPVAMVGAGVTWLVGWAFADGIHLLVSGTPLLGRGTAVAAVGGVGQVLLGSLVYLLPVVLGRGEDLAANRRRMGVWWPLPLVLANIGALALATGATAVATVLVGAWLLDFLVRTAAIGWSARAKTTRAA